MTVDHLALLNGGASRRMGQNKAALQLDGRSLMERTIDVARRANLQVTILGNSGGLQSSNCPVIPDAEPGAGPLSALHRALEYIQQPLILLACDMPAMSHCALQWLARQDGEELGCIPMHCGQAAYTAAWYHPDVLADLNSVAGLSFKQHLTLNRFHTPTVPPRLTLAFQNVNTIDEWQQFLQSRT